MQRPPVDLPLAALETMQGGLSVGRFPIEQLYPQRGAQAPAILLLRLEDLLHVGLRIEPQVSHERKA